MIKKKMSLLLAAVIVATGVGTAMPAFANTALPTITSYTPTVTMVEEGDDFSFALQAEDYKGEVEYRAYVQNLATGEWKELTEGYSEAVDSQTVFTPDLLSEGLPVGKYLAAIYVKRAGVEGAKKNASGVDYDTYVLRNFSVQEDGYFENRVDLNAIEVETTYAVGEDITVAAPAGSKVRVSSYDPSIQPRTDAWKWEAEEYTTEAKFSFDKAGTYLINVHGIEDDATDAVKKLGYSGWKLMVVNVVEEQGIAVESSIKEAMFGSLLTINAEYPGAVKYQAYKDGEVMTKVTDLGKEASVFPAMAEGEEIEVKLLNAAGSVVATTKLNIGETAYVAAPEVKEANVAATVKEAMFGSLVTVTADLEGAVKYQLVDANNEVLTKATEIGKEASVFPAMKAGDEVKVNLLDAEGTVLQTVETALK